MRALLVLVPLVLAVLTGCTNVDTYRQTARRDGVQSIGIEPLHQAGAPAPDSARQPGAEP